MSPEMFKGLLVDIFAIFARPRWTHEGKDWRCEMGGQNNDEPSFFCGEREGKRKRHSWR
jgi:hypothetical protein